MSDQETISMEIVNIIKAQREQRLVKHQALVVAHQEEEKVAREKMLTEFYERLEQMNIPDWLMPYLKEPSQDTYMYQTKMSNFQAQFEVPELAPIVAIQRGISVVWQSASATNTFDGDTEKIVYRFGVCHLHENPAEALVDAEDEAESYKNLVDRLADQIEEIKRKEERRLQKTAYERRIEDAMQGNIKGMLEYLLGECFINDDNDSATVAAMTAIALVLRKALLQNGQ